MTLTDIKQQVSDLAVDQTKAAICKRIDYMAKTLQPGCAYKMPIRLPDGEWLMILYRWGPGRDCYDYDYQRYDDIRKEGESL